ncbi:VTT domain-containing protein [Pelomonas sp. KK5]|uniref:VTT domain-containing protein n=1 Tax=Pelomonas sp. KK5 TaxID=1855730 RepID=UPI00097BCDB4|nr:VTT domain-containing protein [Pelomonas sp. KK5]
MEFLAAILDFALHVDKHLEGFVLAYGPWIYALLFLIIFIETGVVVMPFLPGDSLLFIVGAMCGTGLLDWRVAMPLMTAAAIAGNQSNYTIGRFFGPKVFQWEQSRFFNKKAFLQAHEFYEKYGGVTIVIARFMPFVRTFAPFVAGVAQMTRAKFTMYDVGGGLLWVVGVTSLGIAFGNVPWVRQHLEIIIWATIFIPGLLAIYGGWKAGRKKKSKQGLQ